MEPVAVPGGGTDDVVIERARTQGLHLVRRELDNGQLVWSWQGRDRSWDFLARRQALEYMAGRFG